MPNLCVYDLRAVSRSKETLERLIKIMSYEDPEYYIYRCFECVPCDEIYDNEDGLYSVDITGTVAWACKSWFETEENTALTLGEEHPGYENAHYITLDLLCKRLDIAIDCFGVETGFEFQEHFIVDNTGEILVNECVDYYEYVDDDTGRVVGEGGFGDAYLEFRDCEDLYVDRNVE